MPVATVEEIRALFPALARTHNGFPVAYFDGPGGTQVPRSVAEAMTEYLYNHNANTDWAYPTSAETDAALARAREAYGDFFNASADEIAFGANMTTLMFHLSRTIGRTLSAGDEIIVTELDHHANVDTWIELAKDRNLCVQTVRMIPESGQLDWNHFQSLVNARTKVVAAGAASNALGTVSDVRRAARLAHEVKALMIVDGVHYAPHSLPDVAALECDFFLCSAYKFYGPHVGILWGRKDLIEQLDFPRLRPAHHASPERVETGTLNHEGIVGAGAAVDFFASLIDEGSTRRERLTRSFDELHSRGDNLTRELWKGLSGIDSVQLYGSKPGVPRTSTVAFTVRGVHSREVARRLSDAGLFCSHGDFYAMTVVDRLGLANEGLVRAGCAVYTTPDEIHRLVDTVRSMT